MRSFTALRLSLLASLGVSGGCEAVVEVAPVAGASAGGAANAGGDENVGGSSGVLVAGGSATGGAQPVPITCADPEPILSGLGNDTGYVVCGDGAIDRVVEVPCEDPYPWQPACDGSEQVVTCESDSDCIDGPYGRCVHMDGGPGLTIQCACNYGCATDADCTGKFESYACLCNGITDEPWPIGCMPYECSTGADCASGMCGLSAWHDECGPRVQLTCRRPEDSCHADGDCLDGINTQCGSQFYGEPSFACQDTGCIPGRPMTIDGAARTAPAKARADWQREPLALGPMAAVVRAALAEHWATIAAFEHASVASFARFTLQLLALGAPADLLADTQRAALDEVEHARLAYGLASAFAGHPVGPGPLPESTAPVPTSSQEIVRALVIEGCVGETLGVAEVLTLVAACVEPAVATVLRTIAADEERHAALAWRSLAWMLSRDPSLVAVARAAVEAPSPAFDEALDAVVDRGRGLFSSRELCSVRRQAFREVVEPCLREVLGRACANEGRSVAATSPAPLALEI